MGPMSGDQQSYLAAIEQEEARLRDRLAKLAKFKELAIELGITPEIGSFSSSPNQPASDAPAAPAKTLVATPLFTPVIPKAFSSGVSAPEKSFDGTFAGLIDVYRTHEESPYHKLKHNVRANYDQGINRLRREFGQDRIGSWSAARIQEIYDTQWSAGGKVAMGASMIAKLRLLSSFGSVVLNDDDCIRLNVILGSMRFPQARGRTEVLTYEHARKIRAAAHREFNWPSIALAQALQFEIPKLHQKDILGEWLPLSEPGAADVVNGPNKWVGGLVWSDIDENMMLRREFNSGRAEQAKLISCDLKRFAMVMEEIHNIPPWKRSGPLVICEYSGLPWSASEFRRKWRLVADKAGVPANIKITDGMRGSAEQSSEAESDANE